MTDASKETDAEWEALDDIPKLRGALRMEVQRRQSLERLVLRLISRIDNSSAQAVRDWTRGG